MNNIYLSLNKKIDNLPSEAEVLIVPSKDRWNDFGFRVRVEVGLLVKEAKDIIWLPAYLAIKEEQDTTQYIKNLLSEESQDLISIDKLKLPFALLLLESQQYSSLRNLFGTERSKSILKSLNDISLLSESNENILGWDDFFDSAVFTKAMTRASESYFAFRRGADVLNSVEWFDEDTLKSFSVKLSGDGPKFDFEFNFDSNNLLRGRIAVIVGKNGLGKTASLTKIANALSGSQAKYVQLSRKLGFNQVLAFGYLEAKNLRKRIPKDIHSAAVRSFTFNPKLVRGNNRDGFAKLLAIIARTRDDDGRSFLTFYNSILTQEMRQLRIYLPMKDSSDSNYEDSKGRSYLSLERWVSGGEQTKLERVSGVDFTRNLLYLDSDNKQRKLSTGQYAFMQFSLNALANAGPASIFLIDEPENFLHPNLISQFMRLLNRILKGSRSIAIVATHSPYIVREVQAEQVHALLYDDDSKATCVVKPRLQTLGANVASISNEVFGDDLPEHLMNEILEAVDDSNSFESLLDKYGKEMSVEALMSIRKRKDFK